MLPTTEHVMAYESFPLADLLRPLREHPQRQGCREPRWNAGPVAALPRGSRHWSRATVRRRRLICAAHKFNAAIVSASSCHNLSNEPHNRSLDCAH